MSMDSPEIERRYKGDWLTKRRRWEDAVVQKLNEEEIDLGNVDIGILTLPLLDVADKEQVTIIRGVSQYRLKDGAIAVNPSGFQFL